MSTLEASFFPRSACGGGDHSPLAPTSGSGCAAESGSAPESLPDYPAYSETIVICKDLLGAAPALS